MWTGSWQDIFVLADGVMPAAECTQICFLRVFLPYAGAVESAAEAE